MSDWNPNDFEFDDHGQPKSHYVNEEAVLKRAINELIGLSKGILADGVVNAQEARELASWCCAHRNLAHSWPISEAVQLFDLRYEQKSTQEWLNELKGFLQSLASMPIPGENTPSELPLSRPVPPVEFAGRTFIFTGKFAFGTRTMCQLAVEERGGRCVDAIVTPKVDFLVIGSLSSRDWAHSSFGRKILRAVELSRTTPIKIIDEATFAAAIDTTPPAEMAAAPPPRCIPEDVRLPGINFEPPETVVMFEGRRFFLFGKFKEKRTEQDIKRLGGKVLMTLRADVDYFVVGAATPASILDKGTAHQIDRAHRFAMGCLRIVTEAHLHRFRAGMDRGRG